MKKIAVADVSLSVLQEEKQSLTFREKLNIATLLDGSGVDFSEEKAKEILLESEIDIIINLNDGEFSSTAWGCDLTYDYVKINGDYRT